jgi:hypothetical protein
MKAHTADTNKVAGMNTDVATITGLTNTLRRKICAYATAALINVRMVSIGTVCRSVM